MKYEENQKQTNAINLEDKSKTDNINASDRAVLDKIESVKTTIFEKCTILLQKNSERYRLQQGEHGGENVFFNRNGSDTRFGLTNGIHGTMYLANTPQTAMKEVFQNKLGILESDLNNYYMGTVVIEKDLQVVNLATLIQVTTLTLNDMTTSSRLVTQALAAKVHDAGFDGIQFSSNVTTEECLAVWHDDPSGTGFASTKTQTSLSDFTYKGIEAADILVDQLGIPVEE